MEIARKFRTVFIIQVVALLCSSIAPVFAESATPVGNESGPNVRVVVAAANDADAQNTEITLAWHDNGTDRQQTFEWQGIEIELTATPGTQLVWGAIPVPESGLLPAEGTVDITAELNIVHITLQPATQAEGTGEIKHPDVIPGALSSPTAVEGEPENDSAGTATAALSSTPDAIGARSTNARAGEPGSVSIKLVMSPETSAILDAGDSHGPYVPEIGIIWSDGTLSQAVLTEEPQEFTGPAGPASWMFLGNIMYATNVQFGQFEILSGDSIAVDITLDLTATGDSSLRVQTIEGGPMPEGTEICYWSLRSEQFSDCYIYSGDGYMLTLADVPVGRYLVDISPPDGSGYLPASTQLDVPSQSPFVHTVTLLPAASTSLRVVLRGTDTVPLESLTQVALRLASTSDSNDNAVYIGLDITEGTPGPDGESLVWSVTAPVGPHTWDLLFRDSEDTYSGAIEIQADGSSWLEIVLSGEEQAPATIAIQVEEASGLPLPEGIAACMSDTTLSVFPATCMDINPDGTASFDVPVRGSVGRYRVFIVHPDGTPYHSTFVSIPGLNSGETYEVYITLDSGQNPTAADKVTAETSTTMVQSGDEVTLTFTGAFPGTEFYMLGNLPAGLTVNSVTCTASGVSVPASCASIDGNTLTAQGVFLAHGLDAAYGPYGVTVTVTGTLAGEVGSEHTAVVCGVSNVTFTGGVYISGPGAANERAVFVPVNGLSSPGSGTFRLMALQTATTTLGGASMATVFLGGLIYLGTPPYCDSTMLTIVAPPVDPEPGITPPVDPEPGITPPVDPEPGITPPVDPEPGITPPVDPEPGITPPVDPEPGITPPIEPEPSLTPTIPSPASPTPTVTPVSTPTVTAGHPGVTPTPTTTSPVTGLPSTGTGSGVGAMGTALLALLMIVAGAGYRWKVTREARKAK